MIEVTPSALDKLFAEAERRTRLRPFCGHSPKHDAKGCESPNIAHVVVALTITGSMALGGICDPCSKCQHPDHADESTLRSYTRPFTVKPS